MGLIEKAKDFLWKIAFQKGLKRGLQVGAAFVLAKLCKIVPSVAGLDPAQLQTELTVSFVAGLEVFRNWLKMRTGWTWL